MGTIMCKDEPRSLTALQNSLLNDGKSPAVHPENPLFWGDQLLPNWAYDFTAASSKKCGNENYVVGPAVPKAAKLLLVFFTIYLVNPMLAYFFTDCPEHDGLASYSPWLAPFWLIVMFCLFKLEVEILKYPIVPHVKRTAPFKLMGYPLRFSVWFAVASTMSVMGQGCFVTNGLFLAKALKTDSCQALAARRFENEMKAYWGEVSVLGNASLSTLAFIVWFTTFPQFLYVIAISYPVSMDYKTGKPVSYEVQSKETECAKYDTLFAAQQHHGPVLQALAECSRMATVTFNHWSYRQEKGRHTRLSHKEIPRLVLKFLVFYCIAAGPQLAIQVATMKYSGGDSDYQTATSIFINLMMALKALGTESRIVWNLWRSAEIDMDNPTFDAKSLDGLHETLADARFSIRKWVLIFALLGLCFAAWIGSSAAEAVKYLGSTTFAIIAVFIAISAFAGWSLVLGYGLKRTHSHIKVRMINWKVGLQRPSEADAVQVVAGDASASVIVVYEMEMPRDTGKSASELAVGGGVPYVMLREHREAHKKYLVVLSVLVRKGADAKRIMKVEEPQVVCRSPGKRTHKVALAQAVRFDLDTPVVLYLAGVNLDPHEKEFYAQLDQMENWLRNMESFAEAVLFVGDFNCRLPCPAWASLKAVDGPEGEKMVLTQETVHRICANLASAQGRRDLAQLDSLAPSAKGVPHAERLKKIMTFFDPMSEKSDPGFPTYKRTPGLVPQSNVEVLDQVFFQMPSEKEGHTINPQRYVTGQLGGGVQELQIGWLDRASCWLRPNSGLQVHISSHKGMSKPALSDHAATVTEFMVKVPVGAIVGSS